MVKVYVKTEEINNQNIITDIITDINSDIFQTDLTGWTQIDEGEGDKYTHAQNLYLDDGLIDVQRRYNYKLIDDKPVELTEQEKEILFPPIVQSPSIDSRISSLEDAVNALLSML